MKANEAIIAWTPTGDTRHATAGQVEVGTFVEEGDEDWIRKYRRSAGAAMLATRRLEGDPALAMIFIEFHTLVVRDGIAPEVAHEAFLEIDEYALAISRDIPGARSEEEDF